MVSIIYHTREGIFFSRFSDELKCLCGELPLIKMKDILTYKLHRENGPALMTSENQYIWYYNGMIHNTKGYARAFTDDNGKIYAGHYFLYNVEMDEKTFHESKHLSENEIIAKFNCYTMYHKNGYMIRLNINPMSPINVINYSYLHRIDGPALIFPDGQQFWYINGNELTEEEFNIEKLKWEI